MATNYKKFMAFLSHLADYRVPQMLGTVVSLVAIGLGLSMYFEPVLFEKSFIFKSVFSFASPFAWGTVYLVSAVAVLGGVYTNVRNAQAPVFMLGATFATQGLLTVPQIADGGIPSPVFLYMGLSWVCFVLQLICGASRRGPNETTIGHN